MSENDRYAEPPARVNILPGFVNIADAVSLVRSAASRRDPANRVSSAADIRTRAREDAGLSGWNAAWHTLRQGLLEGSIAAFECDHRGRTTVLLPAYWQELFEAPPDDGDVFGLRRRERTEPSPFKDWRSTSTGGRYVVDQAELQAFIAKEFPAVGKTSPARGRRGRKKEFDEVAIISEAANIMLVQPRAKRPKSREQLIERLLAWYELNYPRAPDRNTIQPWISQFWDHLDFDND